MEKVKKLSVRLQTHGQRNTYCPDMAVHLRERKKCLKIIRVSH